MLLRTKDQGFVRVTKRVVALGLYRRAVCGFE